MWFKFDGQLFNADQITNVRVNPQEKDVINVYFSGGNSCKVKGTLDEFEDAISDSNK